jgi:hypothetical protein
MEKNGLIAESNKAYHSYMDAISKSRLSKMAICPEYFKWHEDNPQAPTQDLILGSALHTVVLEECLFNSEFAILPIDIDRRTKAGKEQYNNFLIENANKEIISQEDFEIICKMRDKIKENKFAAHLLKGSYVETSIYFKDDLTQENIKVRPDCIRVVGDRFVITDLKSCRSAFSDDFSKEVIKYGYDLQAYMYRLGVSKTMGVPIEDIDFVFVAIEKKEPFLINILQADKYIFERGEMLFRKYIGMYHECKNTGIWWGLNGKQGLINNLSLPNYLLKEIQEEN